MRRGRHSSVMVNVKAAQNQHKRPSGSGLEIRLLGPMTLQIAGKAVALPSKRVRALLAYLVQREGVAIARTTLTGLPWGERDEGQARASLRQSLSELRAGLGETSDALDGSKEAITWRSDAAWVDTKVLEAAAQSQDMDALGEAAAFSSGEFLEGLAIDEPGFDHGSRQNAKDSGCFSRRSICG
jgi:DNA-binding SARP family transcriptional activator